MRSTRPVSTLAVLVLAAGQALAQLPAANPARETQWLAATAPKAVETGTPGAIAAGALILYGRSVPAPYDVRVAGDPDRFMPKAKLSKEIKAKKAGFLTAMEARTVGFASVALGAGRAKAEDGVDFGAGFILEKRPGDRVSPGDIIARAWASSPVKLAEGVKMFESSLAYGPKAPRKEPLIKEIIK